ncbi:NAD(P)/FAD-dependent oxidoreductase [Actinocorallia sp. B10E7]|uniref:NAD(P)/FAD-dependent oxidoreductase n=1 Tax=Actinocorallia sp. B10E7 TaxID=3153558 RepID=UPI00325C9DBA
MVPRIPEKFDVVVLGGGTAGSRIAAGLARGGREVALVEHRTVGGDRVRERCAALQQAADRADSWRRAVAVRDLALPPVPLPPGVTVLHGVGRLDGPGRIEVFTPGAARVHGYGELVLATGCEPAPPPVPGLLDVPVWTPAEAVARDELPRRLVVLGGTPEGCELAQIYARYGSQVTLVAESPRLLPEEAPFTGDLLAGILRRSGVRVRTGLRLTVAEPAEAGAGLVFCDGTVLTADRVLLAAETRPRTAGLGLEHLDLAGASVLPVDGRCRVREGVWAAGSATGHRHASLEQARVVLDNLLGLDRTADYRALPRTVRTSPPVWAAGAVPSPGPGGLVTAGRDLSETVRACLSPGVLGRVELYADPELGVLAGAAAVGPEAADWMAEVALAIRAGLPVAALADVVRAVATYGEAIEPSLRELAGAMG